MTDFNYKEMVKRSFKLAMQQKWLWVYGLVIAIYGGGALNSNFQARDIADNFSKPTASPNIPVSTSPNSMLLPPDETGAALSQIVNWLSQVPSINWLLLFLSIAVLVGFQMLVSWILQLWAKGALIGGIEQARSQKQVTLPQSSPYGLKKLKHLLIYSVLVLGLTLAAVVSLAVLGAVIFIIMQLNETVGIMLGAVTAVIGVATMVVLSVVMTMVGIYAERLIVLKNYTPWLAWKKGLAISKGNFLPTVVTGIVNNAVGCSIGCLTSIGLLAVFGIPFFALVLPLFSDGLKLPTAPQLVGLAGIAGLFIYTNFLINALLAVFRFSMWNDIFTQIEKGDTHAA